MISAETLWLMTATIVLLTLFAAVRRLRRPARTSTAVRSAWFIATATSGTVLVLIAAKVNNLLPNATVIDVAALAVTGIITGYFLSQALTPTSTNKTNG